MPITPTNPFKWRHFPGEVILLCVRWYLRYPLAYQHVSELLAERGVAVDPSCIWRWMQVYAPELDQRCRPHLKPTNKSYRTDETYIRVKAVAQGCRDSSEPYGSGRIALGGEQKFDGLTGRVHRPVQIFVFTLVITVD